MDYQDELYSEIADSEVNARRIAFVEQCFGSAGVPLAQLDRVLVAEGVLVKITPDKAQPRQFFLFNDILVYGNVIINKQKYNKQHIIDLSSVKLEDVDDSKGVRNAFLMKTSEKSITVTTTTLEEKFEWMAHISMLAQKSSDRKKSLDLAWQLEPPTWVPDAMAEKCMRCEDKFSLINRKHHCRSCGFVVCQSCSKQRWVLPRQSPSPLRVCEICYQNFAGLTVQSPLSKTSTPTTPTDDNHFLRPEPASPNNHHLRASPTNLNNNRSTTGEDSQPPSSWSVSDSGGIRVRDGDQESAGIFATFHEGTPPDS